MLQTQANPRRVVTEPAGWRPVALWIGGVAVLLALSGCIGRPDVPSHMQDVPEGQTDYVPEPGKALVVFMRPSKIGFEVLSAVFDVTDGEPEFLGIVTAKTKIAHYTDPGEHRYMVAGRNASFLDAKLLADRTYYSVITARMRTGLGSAYFKLKPVHKDELTSAKFAQWNADTAWVENTPDSRKWAQKRERKFKKKQNYFRPKWLARTDKPILLPNDGS